MAASCSANWNSEGSYRDGAKDSSVSTLSLSIKLTSFERNMASHSSDKTAGGGGGGANFFPCRHKETFLLHFQRRHEASPIEVVTTFTRLWVTKCYNQPQVHYTFVCGRLKVQLCTYLGRVPQRTPWEVDA